MIFRDPINAVNVGFYFQGLKIGMKFNKMQVLLVAGSDMSHRCLPVQFIFHNLKNCKK